jgi:hypothetical protein
LCWAGVGVFVRFRRAQLIVLPTSCSIGTAITGRALCTVAGSSNRCSVTSLANVYNNHLNQR